MGENIDEHFVAAVTHLHAQSSIAADEGPLPAARLLDLFDAQLGSRHLDLAARELRAAGRGYYTIGSAGHESNAVVAAALRTTDPALLHYRSGGFFLERAQRVGGSDPLRDVLLGMFAATAEPIAGGRHKVFGRVDLTIVPQTSTIASHLPRAVGVAFAIGRAARLRISTPWPADAVTVCSFGDASASHSTAVGAINTAIHTAYQGIPLPLLLVCEDNGIGISVRTPTGWIATSFSQRAGLAYFAAEGDDPTGTYEAAHAAAEWVRTERRPAFLHLRTVRLMGHAGSDFEPGYRSPQEISADYARDPLLATARLLVEHGFCTPEQVLHSYEDKRTQVRTLADHLRGEAELDSPSAVLSPLTETLRDALSARPTAPVRDNGAPETALTLAQAVNRALDDTLTEFPEALLFGEDVARKGGVYGVTRGLRKRFGANRVFDTLLDEQSILGLALGAGLAGLLPIAEIQYLAYLHNAADQLRGEAATLQFFSRRQYRNPMVVRIAGYGYQKGFGGHFHNDNAVAALRDIPGLVIASPARPDDAAAMLRTCVAAARQSGAVCVYLEPIALYHTRDLHEVGDDGWLAPYPADVDHAPIGRARTYGDGDDLTLISFGNGVRMSLRVCRRLAAKGIRVRVLDIRWLAPLPRTDILRAAASTGRVLVVDETRHAGGVGEGIVTILVEGGFGGPIVRVTSADSFIPLGAAALEVLLSEDEIEAASTELAQRR
ncbi:thiamine pyrophosphate-dependent enzyme [Aldersonia sp. NBC_00410]|uniref:thiamine pyrophosphate-dependent enzyme n=1 Tax=Aldersonia sp. NBC_00410 TaxID=2975954 RepID=UPI00225B8B21|nr:thiamine pyrophosphate-dependent enzyme [Aldersonia sp. NBC_00410]MCX5045767.1 thiamine pyrophosphate-dependent enzyme [Aldersonia sp. NBC_00410]